MNKIKWCVLGFALLIIIFANQNPSKAAQKYITELCVVKDSVALEKMVKKGYISIETNLNLDAKDLDENDGSVYILYKLGNKSNAITDIRVSNLSHEVLGKYKRVSDISLNRGTNGRAIYLYYSKDKNTGEPLRAIRVGVNRNDSSKKEYIDRAIANDGSISVRKIDSNKVANLDEGRKGMSIFLYMIKDTLMKPYIESIDVFTADNKEAAIGKIADAGYNYYLDENVSDTKKCTLIGYEKTSDKKSAIRDIVIVKKDDYKAYKRVGKLFDGKYLAYSKDEKLKSRIYDISYKDADTKFEIELSRWAEYYYKQISPAMQAYLLEDSEYQRLKNNREICVKFPVIDIESNEKTKLAILASKKDYSEKKEIKEAIDDKKMDSNKEAEENIEDTVDDEKEQKEQPDLEQLEESAKKMEQPETQTDLDNESDQKEYATTLKRTNIAFVIISIIVVAVIVFVIIRKRKKDLGSKEE